MRAKQNDGYDWVGVTFDKKYYSVRVEEASLMRLLWKMRRMSCILQSLYLRA